MSINTTTISLFPVRRDKQIPIGLSLSGSTSYGGSSTTSSEGKIISDTGGISKTTTGLFSDGSAAAPSISFKMDIDTGFFKPGANQIGVSTSGTENFRFDNDDFYAKGDIVGFSSYISDRRLKDNIQKIQSGLSIIRKLQGIKYIYKVDEKPHYGLVAQDVQHILPEIVVEHTLINDDNTKYLTIRYSEIIPHLVEAIKELNKQVDELKSEINFWRNYNT